MLSSEFSNVNYEYENLDDLNDFLSDWFIDNYFEQTSYFENGKLIILDNFQIIQKINPYLAMQIVDSFNFAHKTSIRTMMLRSKASNLDIEKYMNSFSVTCICAS